MRRGFKRNGKLIGDKRNLGESRRVKGSQEKSSEIKGKKSGVKGSKEKSRGVQSSQDE